MTLRLRYDARSHVGLIRHNNQDSMYAGPHLLAVADGMGGHAAGEVASRVAIETVAPLDAAEPGADLITGLRDAVETASAYLRDMVAADSALDGMGTTLTALLFAGHRLGLVHIGDSRGYLLRDGVLVQITHDHTLVQHLVDEGRITPEEASVHPQRSWITRSLTGNGELEMDLSIREARAGDRYLLCSDGLSGVVSEETLTETLTGTAPEEAVDRLVDLALRAGGPDNITCVVADVVDDAADPPAADSPIVGGAVAEGEPPDDDAGRGDSPAARAARLRDRPPGRGSSVGRRLSLTLAALVLLVALAALGTWLYARSQYYVAAAGHPPTTVAVFRGVSGSVLGIDLASVQQHTDLPVTALPAYEQPRVRAGIDADGAADARRIVAQLRQEACATATPTATPTSAGGAAAQPTPTPTDSATPAYCVGA